MRQSVQAFSPETNAVCILRDAVLLRTISHGVLPDDASLVHELVERVGDILSSLAVLENLDFPIQLVLCPCLVRLEGLEDV
ncbi:hypothetical protein PLICRDRAFT_79131, partial [Plicaturopsis crispa FD-325 SS-3]